MPLYDYRCTACSEVTEVFAFINSKPETVECSSCKSESKFVFVAPKKKKEVKKELKIRRPKLTVHSFICYDCNVSWKEVVDRDSDPLPEDGRDCMECGEPATWQPSCKIDRFSETFPYYDRGLGMMLQSKKHRREVCKEKNLTPVDGDWDIESVYSKWDVEKEKDIADYEDYCDKLDNHPGFKTFRKKRDLGLI